LPSEHPPAFLAGIDAALAEAAAHFGASRLPAAAAIGQQLLALRPKLAETLHLLGAIALKQDQFGEATGLFQQALALDGTVARFHNSQGQAHRARGAPALALACYERALALDPRFGLAGSCWRSRPRSNAWSREWPESCRSRPAARCRAGSTGIARC
jgi:tetratricopeptide (TPR) repeat protein